MMVVWMII